MVRTVYLIYVINFFHTSRLVISNVLEPFAYFSHQHQLTTAFIMDKCVRATWPFLFLNRFFNDRYLHSLYETPKKVFHHLLIFLLTWAESSSELFWSPVVRRPVVRLSVRLSVNFYIFDFFSRTTGSILIRLSTNYP
jgi:hypothetical protein